MWWHLSNYVARYDMVVYVHEEIVIVWCMFSLYGLQFTQTTKATLTSCQHGYGLEVVNMYRMPM